METSPPSAERTGLLDELQKEFDELAIRQFDKLSFTTCDTATLQTLFDELEQFIASLEKRITSPEEVVRFSNFIFSISEYLLELHDVVLTRSADEMLYANKTLPRALFDSLSLWQMSMALKKSTDDIHTTVDAINRATKRFHRRMAVVLSAIILGLGATAAYYYNEARSSANCPATSSNESAPADLPSKN
ncbi:MAG: hypothetical protein UT33_C0012G0029 [Candidatus Peregrinibacteria bacterium GW2011_GWC2_39_14]|nr:MAG: hypothetical protein US92_C0003G0056 [Candidatus Peregrinibacteria bacterium GW2011_GWA2_38_36]KKR05224.1 MAG: hypothetical protein UT33_C0012G0029 [Candidatus Peregrinibacteria bacterium GW2011_GWC2_39_14]